jgi:mRNA interferase MazF
VRFKLFTLDHRLVRGRIGRLSDADTDLVRARLHKLFGGIGE